MMPSITFWLVSCALIAEPVPAARELPAEVVVSEGCLVSLIDQALVPALRAGQITTVYRRDGDDVAKGELLVQLDDRDPRARHKCAQLELAIARLKAESRTLYEAALKSSALEDLEYDSSVRLFERNVIAKLEHERERTQAELAKIKIAETKSGCVQADLIRDLREAELELAQIELDDHEVRAPYDGTIVELFHRTGDWVDPEQPVLRLLRMDRLKVETFLDSQRVAPHLALGLPVVITISMAGGQTRLFDDCHIDYVCPELEPSGEYRIWVEVANVRHSGRQETRPQWLLRPGMTAQMKVCLEPGMDTRRPALDELAETQAAR